MSAENMFERNRAAWNQAMEYHQKALNNSLQVGFEDPCFTALNRDCDVFLIDKLNHIDFNGKTISHIPCNNGRESLSLMRRGAKEGIGFDISDTAILEAKQLAGIAKLNATFIRMNVLEIGEEYNDYFDFIFISQGSLQWFPNMDDYFGVVSRLLKKGGQILIFEIHPFAYFFENGFRFDKQNFDKLTSYFEKKPYNYPTGLDYFGEVEYESNECLWFMHKISDIINAVLRNGIEIQDFDEYDIDLADNPDTKNYEKFPLSYILTGQKK